MMEMFSAIHRCVNLMAVHLSDNDILAQRDYAELRQNKLPQEELFNFEDMPEFEHIEEILDILGIKMRSVFQDLNYTPGELREIKEEST